METLERVLSRPVAKPYRSRNVQDEGVYLNDEGLLDFNPDYDIESASMVPFPPVAGLRWSRIADLTVCADPKCWSTARRGYITSIAVLLVVNATFASSAPSGCLHSIGETFNVSREASGLVITLFLLGYCAGPLLWAPLSEFYGRRYIFHLTFFGYFVFNFACAFTPTFAGLLVARFLTGTFASAAISNSPGVLADIWDPVERGNAMALFSVMTFVGPALGPVTAGFFELKLNWR